MPLNVKIELTVDSTQQDSRKDLNEIIKKHNDFIQQNDIDKKLSLLNDIRQQLQALSEGVPKAGNNPITNDEERADKALRTISRISQPLGT